MKNVLFISLVIIISYVDLYAQLTQISNGAEGMSLAQSQFQFSISAANDYSRCQVLQASDGGYVLASATYSFGAGNSDMYLVKLDSNCNLQWTKTLGGANNDWPNCIIRSMDGGYVMAGETWSFGAGGDDMYIVKLSSNGTLLWSRTIGGSDDDAAFSIVQTSDGGYTVAGGTYSFGAGDNDMYIIKLDSTGILQWSKTVGGIGYDEAHSIIQTIGGGYLIVGNTRTFGTGDSKIYIVKLNDTGALQWSRIVNGGSNNDYANSTIQTRDSGYVITGVTYSFTTGHNSNMYVVKLSSSGNIQWTTSVGANYNNESYSIIQTTDGGYALAGGDGPFQTYGTSHMYIVKLDSNGMLTWSRYIGGTSIFYPAVAYSIIQVSDGGYVLAGDNFGAEFGMNIIKLDNDGNTCATTSMPQSLSGSGGTMGIPASILNSQNSIINSPPTAVSSGGTLTTNCVALKTVSYNLPDSYELRQNSVYPFNPKTNIKFSLPHTSEGRVSNTRLTIYDIIGNVIAVLVNEPLKPGSYEVNFDGSDIASGIYFYELQAGDFVVSKKMILLK